MDEQRGGPIDNLRAGLGRFPRPLWLLAVANFVLFAARGMTIPFLVIFFGQILGLGEGLVGSGLAVNAVAGIVFTLLVAGSIDRFGARTVLIITIVGTAATTALFPLATTPLLFYVVMAVQGMFTQLYWPSSDALATSLVPVEQVGEMFALIRVANALGIGFGGLLGGLIVAADTLAAYRLLYLSAGAGIALAGVLVFAFVRPGHLATPGVPGASEVGVGSWRAVFRDRRFIYSQIVMFVLLCGFTQLQVSAPPYLRKEAGVGEMAIGLLFTVNTLIVVVAQLWTARRIAGWGRGTTFAIASLFWSVAYLMIGASSWALWLPFAAIVVYTVGEMLFMPTSGVIIIELAPEHLRGRYLAFGSVVWGSAWGLASWASGIVLASDWPTLLWPGLVTLLLIGALGGWSLDRLLPQPTVEPARQRG